MVDDIFANFRGITLCFSPFDLDPSANLVNLSFKSLKKTNNKTKQKTLSSKPNHQQNKTNKIHNKTETKINNTFHQLFKMNFEPFPFLEKSFCIKYLFYRQWAFVHVLLDIYRTFL